MKNKTDEYISITCPLSIKRNKHLSHNHWKHQQHISYCIACPKKKQEYCLKHNKVKIKQKGE